MASTSHNPNLTKSDQTFRCLVRLASPRKGIRRGRGAGKAGNKFQVFCQRWMFEEWKRLMSVWIWRKDLKRLRWDEAPLLCYSKHNEVGLKVPLWSLPPSANTCQYHYLPWLNNVLWSHPRQIVSHLAVHLTLFSTSNSQFSLRFHTKKISNLSYLFVSHLFGKGLLTLLRNAINQSLGQPSLLLMSNPTSRCYNHRAAESNWANNNYSEMTTN